MPEFNPGLIPSRSPLLAILAAAGILVATAGAVFYFNPHNTADLSITRVQIYSAHTQTQGIRSKAHVMGMAAREDNDLYVLINVKITDKLRLPLFIKDETAVLTAPDHTITEVSALQTQELANAYAAFPALRALASAPLTRDTKIAPGQTAEGMVLLYFPGAKEADWNSRESASLTFNLFHQSPQTITIPK